VFREPSPEQERGPCALDAIFRGAPHPGVTHASSKHSNCSFCPEDVWLFKAVSRDWQDREAQDRNSQIPMNAIVAIIFRFRYFVGFDLRSIWRRFRSAVAQRFAMTATRRYQSSAPSISASRQLCDIAAYDQSPSSFVNEPSNTMPMTRIDEKMGSGQWRSGAYGISPVQNIGKSIECAVQLCPCFRSDSGYRIN
jgi:hypothetical protein